MNSVIEYIKEYAVSQPDKYAVCELRKNVTYRQYWERIGKMAEVDRKSTRLNSSHL